MSRRLLNLAGCFALTLATSAVAFAQTQPTQPTQTTVTTKTTQAVQNPDGSWTVIEYPANKEVIVDFTPGTTYATAKGRAKVMRMADHTMINLDLTGLPADATSFNLYAVDPMGKATLIGPVNITNGVATQSFNTPLDKFMLVLSPEANLTTYTPDIAYAFRSAVPQGLAVVPLSSHGERDGAAVAERVSATSTASTTSAYAAPLLGIPGFRRGTDTEMKINFSGALTGSRANVFIEPRKDGPTTIKMRFHELKDAPAGYVYALWAVSADNKFVKLGQIVNPGTRNEAQIQTETALRDFGLLVTLEPETSTPSGTVVGTIIRP
ncbi:MAG: anti-sigma factor [Acidobacteria bacterium]|nr:anti-sigma factor [Acidobacteriota bacterium]